MKIELKLEFITNIMNKEYFVYRIKQTNHKDDIRLKAKDISIKLYNYIKDNSLDAFYYLEETPIERYLKIFLLVYCDNATNKLLKDNLFNNYEGIIESFKEDKFQLNEIMFKNKYMKIAKAYFDNILVKYDFEKIGTFYIIGSLDPSYFNKNPEEYQCSIVYSFEEKDFSLISLSHKSNTFYLIILLQIDCGVVYFKTCAKKPTEIKKYTSKNSKFQFYSKTLLSPIKAELHNKKLFLEDTRSSILTELKSYHDELLVNYPFYINSKCKLVFPVLIRKIFTIINHYSEYVYSFNVLYGLIGIGVSNILVCGSEADIIKMKIESLDEEETDKIYDNVSKEIEEDRCKFISFGDLIFSYIDRCINGSYQENIFDDLNLRLFLFLKSQEKDKEYIKNTLIPDCKGKCTLYDEEFVVNFEEKILEFFSVIIEVGKRYNEIRNSHYLARENNSVHLVNNFSIVSEEIEKINTTLNASMCEENQMPRCTKPIIKPFNKAEILLQEKCEVDYGNKRITNKEIKARTKYIKDSIRKANQQLEDEIENEIIRRTFMEDNKRVIFTDLPNPLKIYKNNI